MSHFFVNSSQITADVLTIVGDDVNHMKNVLRMRNGEAFTAADENGIFYHCEVELLEKEQVTAKILNQEQGGSELSSKIYLFQGLPKSDKMELIIQKAVELGASEIIPVATKRCVVKLDAKKEASKIILLKQVIEALGSYAIDREDIRQSMQVINQVTEEVKKGW